MVCHAWLCMDLVFHCICREDLIFTSDSAEPLRHSFQPQDMDTIKRYTRSGSYRNCVIIMVQPWIIERSIFYSPALSTTASELHNVTNTLSLYFQ